MLLSTGTKLNPINLGKFGMLGGIHIPRNRVKNTTPFATDLRNALIINGYAKYVHF